MPWWQTDRKSERYGCVYASRIRMQSRIWKWIWQPVETALSKSEFQSECLVLSQCFFFWFFGTFSNNCSYQWVSLERQGICVNCRLLLGASPRIGSENEKISAESHSLFLSYKRFFKTKKREPQTKNFNCD